MSGAVPNAEPRRRALERLLEAGAGDVPVEERERLVLFNVVVWASGLIVLFTLPVHIATNGLVASIPSAIFIVWCALVLALTAAGRPVLGRVLNSLGNGLALFFLCCLMGEGTGLMTYAYPALAIPFAVFSYREMPYIVVCTAFPAIASIGCEAVGYDIGWRIVAPENAHLFRWFQVPSAYGLLLLIVAIFANNRLRILRGAEDALHLNTAILDGIGDAVFVTDPAGQVLKVNRAAGVLTPDGARGVRKIASLLRVPDGFDTRSAARDLETLARCEGEFEGGDGNPIPVEVRRTESEDGDFRVLVVRDLREEKEARRRLAELDHDLLASSRRGGMAEVARSVLHNVGNVLNSVNVSASLMVDALRQSKLSRLARAIAHFEAHGRPGDTKEFELLRLVSERLERDEGELREELGMLLDGIDQVREAIRRQRDFARDDGAVDRCEIGQLIDIAATLVSPDLTRAGMNIEVEIPADAPTIEVDRLVVSEVLVQLLRNAYDAMLELEPAERVVHLRAEFDEADFRIQVSDRGSGFSESTERGLFTSGFTTKPGGHGMSLHDSANAIRARGGGISAHSPGPDQGAVFTLRLPIHPARPLSAPPA